MRERLSRRTFIAAGLGAGAAALARWDTHPDAVLYNGAILTMGSRVREVEALALAGSRVVALGASAEMLALAGSGTRRIDLGGKRVTPGFNDAHSHPGASGVALLTQVPLDMDSIDSIKAAIHAKAAATPPGQLSRTRAREGRREHTESSARGVFSRRLRTPQRAGC